ncbi:hypothetical protein [Sulfurisphaera tokodaii]|uniref:Uncharacterized protein n=2 Tax=Sulfurisphaera tokodaii TaxID=111955 RepID=Q96XJ9_SULTO|nr:hypothetical protein [Sulfurisphaera tokodaii]BAB67628.1 hypothetical protein STK_25150 [Sulfurisphaera tokodaii str. 7]HII75313.1 hypothetical protein [Sulfurisphaera tokodaii]
MNVKELYKIMLVGINSTLMIIIADLKTYILILLVILLSIYLIEESRIPNIKNEKTFYKYISMVYGKNAEELVRKKFIVTTQLQSMNTLKDNTIVINGNNLIIKFNSKVITMNLYEGIDYLINIIKNS